MNINILVFIVFVVWLARLAGWRIPLPRAVWDVLSRKSAGQPTRDSTAASDDSGTVGDDDLASGSVDPNGILFVDKENRGVNLRADTDKKPSLAERLTSRIERWSGEGETVVETVVPETSQEERRAQLNAHLIRELKRPGLTTTAIVQAAANQADAPWGRVSESTVWRAYASLSKNNGG